MQAAEEFVLDHRRIQTRLGPLRAAQALDEHRRSRAWLAQELSRNGARRTVVITHHAPHPGSIHPRYAGNAVNGAFVSDLTGLVEQADLWLHGHVHDSFDYRSWSSRIRRSGRTWWSSSGRRPRSHAVAEAAVYSKRPRSDHNPISEELMKEFRWEPVVVAACALAAGCSTVSLAPGADQVRVTSKAADVAACTSVGSVQAASSMLTDPDAERQMQNQTLTLGGNVLLFSSPLHRSGTAYHCGDAGASSGGVVAAPAAVIVQAPAQIVQAQLDAYNRRDLEAFLSFYADDAQIIDYPDQVLAPGKDAMRERYRKLFEPAPDLHAAILNRIAFDRFVIDQEKVTGRADGQPIEAVAVYEIRDGKIARVTLLRR